MYTDPLQKKEKISQTHVSAYTKRGSALSIKKDNLPNNFKDFVGWNIVRR